MKMTTNLLHKPSVVGHLLINNHIKSANWSHVVDPYSHKERFAWGHTCNAETLFGMKISLTVVASKSI